MEKGILTPHTDKSEVSMTEFWGLCINTTLDPIFDDGTRGCKKQSDGGIPTICAYKDRWNECPNFKPLRQVKKEMR